MRFIVYLYKEGPPMDGDEFVCGPYSDEDQAGDEATALRPLGSVRVLPLFDTAEDIVTAI